MADTSGMDTEFLALLERYNTRSVNDAFQNMGSWETSLAKERLVKHVQDRGEAGLWNLRQVLLGERGFDTSTGCSAAEIISEIKDVESFKPLFGLIARLWQTYNEHGHKGSPAALARIYAIIGDMIEPARQAGYLDEPVLQHLRLAVEASDHVYLNSSLMDTAARTHDAKVLELLVKYATYGIKNELWKALLDQSQPWEKPEAALYALRFYPEMQAMVLSLTNHPHPEMASTAAKALFEMLNLLPGEGGADYEKWKTWAMSKVPAELKPVKPGGLKGLFKSKPVLTRQQKIFWGVCLWRHGQTYPR